MYKGLLYVKIYYKLSVTITETEKSHDLSSASWRLRKASGIVRRSESKRADSANSSLGLKPENQSTGSRRRLMLHLISQPTYNSLISEFNFPWIFVFCRPLKDWVLPTHIEEGHLLYSVPNSNTILFLKHPADTPRQCLTTYLACCGPLT